MSFRGLVQNHASRNVTQVGPPPPGGRGQGAGGRGQTFHLPNRLPRPTMSTPRNEGGTATDRSPRIPPAREGDYPAAPSGDGSCVVQCCASRAMPRQVHPETGRGSSPVKGAMPGAWSPGPFRRSSGAASINPLARRSGQTRGARPGGGPEGRGIGAVTCPWPGPCGGSIMKGCL